MLRFKLSKYDQSFDPGEAKVTYFMIQCFYLIILDYEYYKPFIVHCRTAVSCLGHCVQNSEIKSTPY